MESAIGIWIALEENITFVHLIQTHDRIDGRRLASAVAQQRHDLAFSDLQRYPVQHLEVPIIDMDII